MATVLPLGLALPLSVVFTPDDPTLFTTAAAIQTIDVISDSRTPVGMFVGRVTDASTSMPLVNCGASRRNTGK